MKQKYPTFPHRPISFRIIPPLIMISAASVVFQWAIGYALSKWFPLAAANMQAQSLRMVNQLTLKYTLGTMTFWVAEELIFRGFLLQLLRRVLSTWLAVLLTAIFFALEHLPGGAPTVELAFLYSFYLAWLMIKTDSIYAPIIAHWALDFSILYVFLPLRGITAIAATGRTPPDELFLFPWYAYLLAVVLLIIAINFQLLRREFRGKALEIKSEEYPFDSRK